jgi:hypothetical protein
MNRFLAGILLLAFIAFGVKGLIELRLVPLLKPDAQAFRRALQPDATTDDYLRQLLSEQGVPAAALSRPSAAIRESIKRLPSSAPILFIAPRVTPSNQLAFLVVKGLSFPHLLQYASCDSQEKVRVSDRLGALLLYALPTVGTSNASTVIPQLTMIPGDQARQWTAYCSR